MILIIGIFVVSLSLIGGFGYGVIQFFRNMDYTLEDHVYLRRKEEGDKP